MEDDVVNEYISDEGSNASSEIENYPVVMSVFPFDEMQPEEHEDDGGAPVQPTFDEDLPAVHSYLGENLSEVSGRMIYSENRVVSLPLLTGQFGHLLPGQTFPLTVRDFTRSEMLRACVEGDHTFACVSSRQPTNDYIYGTTAEIYEYSDDMGTICIKAKGRQRFQLLSTKGRRPDVRMYRMGEVLILPEVKLTHPFNALDYKSLNGLRFINKERCRKIEANLMPYPKWVYDMYDPEKLVARADKLSFLKQGLRRVKGHTVMPKDPTELSFWIAGQLDVDKRLLMLKLNSPIPRLRWLLSFLSKNQEYVCGSCEAMIGKEGDMFSMSAEGAQNLYVNPEGFHHDTMTLLKAQNIEAITAPSTHFSWFPGYAWSIAVCRLCQMHLGWKFTATDRKMRPMKFWGLTRASLKTQFCADDEDKPEDRPVIYAWSIAVCRLCQMHLGWKFTATDRKMRPMKFWGLTRASLKTQFCADDEDKPEDRPVIYAWSIAVCRLCQMHLGWKFTATDRKMRPMKFWGLTRASLKTQFCADDEDKPEDRPVM